VFLSAMASLLNISFFQKYYEATTSNDGDLTSSVIGVALLASVANTFFGEWAFLPEVILASVSPMEPSKNGVADNPQLNETLADNQIIIPTTATAATSTSGTNTPMNLGNGSSDTVEPTRIATHCEDTQQRIAVEYGSLISCIDFGDQLGSLAAGPLVAVLGISRENGFLHLDHLILICALSSVIVTFGMLPLLWNK